MQKYEIIIKIIRNAHVHTYIWVCFFFGGLKTSLAAVRFSDWFQSGCQMWVFIGLSDPLFAQARFQTWFSESCPYSRSSRPKHWNIDTFRCSGFEKYWKTNTCNCSSFANDWKSAGIKAWGLKTNEKSIRFQVWALKTNTFPSLALENHWKSNIV